MGAAADVRTYFYWSERRIARIARDNGLDLTRAGSTKLKTPTGPFLPSMEVDRPRRGLSRDEAAGRIERYLSGVTVRDFVTPPPVRFAAGHGTLTFAQFKNFTRVEEVVSIFTETTATDGTRVAVCMFGSLDNLADVIAAAPTEETGWSSSAAPEVFRFISSAGGDMDRRMTPEEIAVQAVNLLCHQGGTANEPSRRGFTYGHLGDSGEWLLEAYLDVDLPRRIVADTGVYDRVVVGAPLWVRTPAPQTLILYGEDPDPPAPFPPSRKRWWRRR